MDSRQADTTPWVAEVTVPVAPEAAFAAYTAGIGRWWPAAYTPDPDGSVQVVVEPEVGGRLLMRSRGSAEGDTDAHSWGEVTHWDPGHGLGHDFWLAHPPESPSTIAVTFTGTPTGTVVRLVHGGWHAGNVEHRTKYTEWQLILDEYAAYVATAAEG